MKRFIPVIIFLYAASASAQVSLSAGATVDGVALGATYKEVVAKFGKPLRERTNKMDECIGDRTRVVEYPGLKFELAETNGTFTVYNFELTSAKHEVSGVRVGDQAAAVQKRFGTRGRKIEKSTGGTRWFYEMPAENPGGTSVQFRAGRVVSISSSYMMC